MINVQADPTMSCVEVDLEQILLLRSECRELTALTVLGSHRDHNEVQEALWLLKNKAMYVCGGVYVLGPVLS